MNQKDVTKVKTDQDENQSVFLQKKYWTSVVFYAIAVEAFYLTCIFLFLYLTEHAWDKNENIQLIIGSFSISIICSIVMRYKEMTPTKDKIKKQ